MKTRNNDIFVAKTRNYDIFVAKIYDYALIDSPTSYATLVEREFFGQYLLCFGVKTAALFSRKGVFSSYLLCF